MPYIKRDRREELVSYDAVAWPETPGELNYLITELCLSYLDQVPASYTAYNEIIGVLECAKLEMYRKLVSVYEDQKCQENGEVYSE